MRNILGLFRTQIFKQNIYNLNFRAKISVRSIWIFETKISTLNFSALNRAKVFFFQIFEF